jgi:hypothetical protein
VLATRVGVSRRGRSRADHRTRSGRGDCRAQAQTESRHSPASFHRRIKAVRPAVNRVVQVRFLPVEPRRRSHRVTSLSNSGKFAGFSIRKRGFESLQGYQRGCRSPLRGPELLGYRAYTAWADNPLPSGDSSPAPARVARRPGASPTRKRMMVRLRPRVPTDEHHEPPFRGWDAALRTLPARVRVLPVVPRWPRRANARTRPGIRLRRPAGVAACLSNRRSRVRVPPEPLLIHWICETRRMGRRKRR